MSILKTVLGVLVALAIVVAGVLFGLDNRQEVQVVLQEYAFGPLPLFFWIYLSLFLGILVGLLMMLPKNVILRIRLKRLMQRHAVTVSTSEVPPKPTPIDERLEPPKPD